MIKKLLIAGLLLYGLGAYGMEDQRPFTMQAHVETEYFHSSTPHDRSLYVEGETNQAHFMKLNVGLLKWCFQYPIAGEERTSFRILMAKDVKEEAAKRAQKNEKKRSSN
jgi:hypothetical protein